MARSLRNLLILLFTFGSLNAFAQDPGSIEGVAKDENDEPVIGAIIEVFQGGIKRGGVATDYDGNFTIKPLPPGSYEVVGQYSSYKRVRVTGVTVSPNRTSTVNLSFNPNRLAEVEIKYVAPLIKDGPVTTILSKDDIRHMPNSVELSSVVAASSPGLRTDGRSGQINAGGQRAGGTVTYIDGVLVNGAVPNLPQGAIEELEVELGGMSAKRGDATGAVVNITTRGPSAIYAGNLQLEHSVEGFNHNMANFTLSGPLVSKKLKGGEKKPILGFLLTGEAYYDKNRQPSFYSNYVVKDDVRERLEQKPLLLTPTQGGQPVYRYATEYVTQNDLKKVRVMPNAEVFEARSLAKLDFQVAENMNITAGGNFTYSKGSALAGGSGYNRILFSPESVPVSQDFSGRGYIRFTQRFSRASNDTSKQGRISNAYYTLQADYQKDYGSTEDPTHGRNIFDYGYVGKFYQNRETRYFYDVDTNTGTRMWQLLSYDAPTSFTFDRAEVNPILANYTSQYYELGALPPTIVELRGQRGLANGDFPVNTYNLYPNIGSTLSGYSYNNNDQISAGANASFDLRLGDGKNKSTHAIEFGLYYNQRISSSYGVSANIGSTNSIWQLMRGNVNNHIVLDKNPIYKINGQTYTLQQIKNGEAIPGVFDSLYYNRAIVDSAQTNFDKNLRAKLGLPAGNTDILNVDALDPSMFSLDMFTPDELIRGLGSNNSLVSYFGYDYLGNKQKGQVNFNDYFTEKDANGNYTRNVGAYRPNYIAGYLLDRFKFKEINFNIGVRVDRYDLNTKVLKDPYSIYESYTVGDFGKDGFTARGNVPSNMGSDYVVYVDNNNSSSPSIIGYRNGDDWYNASGQFIADPTILKNASNGRDPQPYLTAPGKVAITDENYDPTRSFTDYKPQTYVSPRIAFQFPINDKSQFYAHYDILVQRPTGPVSSSPADYMFLAQRSQATINNPNLRPEKTFDYEFGFTQALSQYSAVSIAGTYKERKDQIGYRPYLYAWPITYYTYGNRDYSTTKGFYLKYDLRRVKNLRMFVNYTLQFVEGTGSNQNSGANGLLQTFISAQLPNLRYVMPLDFDNRHTISANIDYRFAEGEGPTIKGNRFLQNTGLNLLFTSRSGEPYTRYTQPLKVSNTVKGELNGSRLPWHYMLDLKLDKDFTLSFKKPDAEAGENVKPRRQLYLNAYMYITNVLNTRDVIRVNGFTGQPDDDGYLVSPQGQLDMSIQGSPQSYSDLYTNAQLNPYNINVPRRINFGLNLNF